MNGDPVHTWVSPSNAWLLLACPASHRSAGHHEQIDAAPAESGQTPNAGTLAHKAVELWVKSGKYRDDNDGELLVGLFDEACAKRGVLPSSVRSGVSTRARLKARSSELRGVLGRVDENSQVLTEHFMHDDERMIRGTADLVTTGAHKAVMDLKTGSLGADGEPEKVAIQLALYAHLYAVTFGELPSELLVLSLQRGVSSLAVDKNAISDALVRISDAAREIESQARPAPDSCRFCRRRPDCNEHWLAVVEWEQGDGLEGWVEKVEQSDAGPLAIRVRSGIRSVWLTQILPSMIVGDLVVGALVRAMRVSAVPQRDDEDHVLSWRCGPFSLVQVVS